MAIPKIGGFAHLDEVLLMALHGIPFEHTLRSSGVLEHATFVVACESHAKLFQI